MVVREFINSIGFKVNRSQLNNAERVVNVFAQRIQMAFTKITINQQINNSIGQIGNVVSRNLEKVERKVDKTSASIYTRLNHAFRSMASLSMVITYPFYRLSRGLIDALSEFEGAEISFTTFIGNAEDAKAVLNEVYTLASKTPFTIMEATKGAGQLLATGTPVGEVVSELKMLGDIAAGVNVPLDRIIQNYSQVRAQTYLTGRELRDFVMAKIPVLEELAKKLNKTTQEVRDMISAREIPFTMVRDIFTEMTSVGGRYYDLMVKQSRTLKGMWSNFVDSLLLSARAMGEKLLPTFKRFVGLAIDLMELFNKLDPLFQSFLFIVTAVAAAAIPLAGTISLIGMAIKALGPTLIALSGPVLGLLTLIGLAFDDLIGYFRGHRSLIGYFIPSWEKLSATISKVFSTTKVLFSEFLKGFQQVRDGVDLVFRSLQYGYRDTLDIGLSQISSGLAVMFQKAIEVAIDVIRISMPKILALVETLTPVIAEVGVKLGIAIVSGVNEGITRGGLSLFTLFGKNTSKGLGWLLGRGQDVMTPGNNTKVDKNLTINVDMKIPAEGVGSDKKMADKIGENLIDLIGKNIGNYFVRN